MEKITERTSRIREAARGRWLDILSGVAPELEAAIARVGRHVGCPVHGGRDGFRLFQDAEETGGGICNTCGRYPDGFGLVMWVRGCGFNQALRLVADSLGMDCQGAVPTPRRGTVLKNRSEIKAAVRSKAAAQARAMWVGAAPLQGSIGDLYLARRGIQTASLGGQLRDLRFHPRMRHRNELEETSFWPGLLAKVRAPSGQVVGIHRTYLDDSGRKAPVDQAKKLMPKFGELGGGAIRFGSPIGGTVGVAEGIETALSVTSATGIPCWACVSATLLEAFVPPPDVKNVLIWGDLDRSGAGQRSAKALQLRLWGAGFRAQTLFPAAHLGESKGKGTDWNDVLVHLGPTAFPIPSLVLAA